MLRGVCSFERHKAMQLEQLQSTYRKDHFAKKGSEGNQSTILCECITQQCERAAGEGLLSSLAKLSEKKLIPL